MDVMGNSHNFTNHAKQAIMQRNSNQPPTVPYSLRKGEQFMHQIV